MRRARNYRFIQRRIACQSLVGAHSDQSCVESFAVAATAAFSRVCSVSAPLPLLFLVFSTSERDSTSAVELLSAAGPFGRDRERQKARESDLVAPRICQYSWHTFISRSGESIDRVTASRGRPRECDKNSRVFLKREFSARERRKRARVLRRGRHFERRREGDEKRNTFR